MFNKISTRDKNWNILFSILTNIKLSSKIQFSLQDDSFGVNITSDLWDIQNIKIIQQHLESWKDTQNKFIGNRVM